MTTSTPHRYTKKRLMKAVGAHTPCSCGILFQNRRHEMKHFKRKHVLAIMVTGILIAVAAYYCNIIGKGQNRLSLCAVYLEVRDATLKVLIM